MKKLVSYLLPIVYVLAFMFGIHLIITCNGVLFLFWRNGEAGFEDLNATVQWTAAADGSTEANRYFAFHRKAKCKQIWPVCAQLTDI